MLLVVRVDDLKIDLNSEMFVMLFVVAAPETDPFYSTAEMLLIEIAPEPSPYQIHSLQVPVRLPACLPVLVWIYISAST